MQQFATDQPLSSDRVIQAEQLSQMVDDMFTSMLDMSVNAAQSETQPLCADAMQACVRIDGEWQAELRVIASNKFASLTACAMFGAESDDISEEEVLDALGEVANVIGGNAKGIVDRECNLSIPCVGGDVSQKVHNPEALALSYECEGELLQIFLTEN